MTSVATGFLRHRYLAPKKRRDSSRDRRLVHRSLLSAETRRQLETWRGRKRNAARRLLEPPLPMRRPRGSVAARIGEGIDPGRVAAVVGR